MTYQVVLIQPYLRKFFLNFGEHLNRFTFHNVAGQSISGTGYAAKLSFEQETHRRKLNPMSLLRRILGVPNIRFWFGNRGDLIFTYGSLVVTRKPYCPYIETGLTLYNYDLGMAHNPIARWLVSFFATRQNCKKLIFESEAAKRSFFATVRYPSWVRQVMEGKSVVIYPIPIKTTKVMPKRFHGSLKLLFVGQFYMKGGMEVAHAYEKLRSIYDNMQLTVVTGVSMIKQGDLDYLKSLPGVRVLDAILNEEEMATLYKSHDVFILPTYREGFGLVILEALSYGLPIVTCDQYATGEMVRDGFNGFVYRNHPLQDYDPQTYQLFGWYHEPQAFYTRLSHLQEEEELKPIEDFLVSSISKFLERPTLFEQFSENSLALHQEKFDPRKISSQLEEVFLKAVSSR